MIATRRPVPVLAVAFLFLAVGIVGFVFHFRQLALAWMAFHVGLSAFGTVQELVIHCVIFAGIVWLLFRADSRSYFRPSKEAQA